MQNIRMNAKYETFVRRVVTAETGNLVPLGPPKSRYLCCTKSLAFGLKGNASVVKKIGVLNKEDTY